MARPRIEYEKRPFSRSRNFQKSLWDGDEPRASVYAWTLFAGPEGHRMSIETPGFRTEMRSQKLNDDKPPLLLWTVELPRRVLANASAYLTLTVSQRRLKSLFAREQVSVRASAPVKDDPLSSILFLFAPKFPDGPDNSASAAARELLYFMEALAAIRNFAVLFPQLIAQCPAENKQGADAMEVYEVVERVMRDANYRDGAALAGCVFSVLGSLAFARPPQTELAVASQLLASVTADFVSNLDICCAAEFVSAVARGVAHTLQYGAVISTDVWNHVFRTMLTSKRVASEFFACVLQAASKVSTSQLDICLASLKTIRERKLHLRLLLEKVDSYPSVLRVLQESEELFESGEGVQLAEEALERVKNERAQSYCAPIEAQEIEALLDILATGTSVMREFIYSSFLPSKIRTLFVSPKAGLISLYRRLLVTNYDPMLVGTVNKADLAAELSLSASFAQIVNEFELTETEAKVVFQKWLSTIRSSWYSSSSSSANRVQKIDSELTNIANHDLLPLLQGIAIEFLLQKIPLDSHTVVSVSKTMDQAASLREAFVCHPQVLAKLGEGAARISAQGLLIAREKNAQSWTLDRLLAHCLGVTQAPDLKEVERKLIDEHEIEETWRLLILNYDRYSAFQIASTLKSLVRQFTEKALGGRLSIEQHLRLSTKSESELTELSRLMIAAVAPAALEVSDCVAGLQNTISMAAMIGAALELLASFCASVLSNSPEKDSVLKDIRELQSTYRQAVLCEISLTEEQQRLRETSEAVRPFMDSGLFRNSLLAAQETEAVTARNAQDICMRVIGQMESSIEDLIATLHSKRMAEVLEVFSSVEDWKREVEVLSTVRLEWSEGLAIVAEGLHCFHSGEALRKNFMRLLDIRGTVNLVEDHAMETARDYVNNFSDLSVKLFGDVLRKHRDVHALFPSSDQKEVQEVFEVLAELQSSPELTKFLSELTEERLKHLLECVNDYDESTVTVQLILELENAWQFYSNICRGLSCSALIAEVLAYLGTAKFANLKAQIHTCSFNVRAVMELSVELEKKEEAKRKQIDSIFHSSTVGFLKTARDYRVSASYSERARGLDLAFLLELKDRASLTIHASQSEEDQDGLQVLRIFVDFVQEIQKTVETLTDLYTYGYPQNVAEDLTFPCMNGSFIELKIFEEDTSQLLLMWRKCIEDAYLECYSLTFLFGQQFWEVEQSLQKQSLTEEARSLLAYIGRAPAGVSLEVTGSPTDRLRELGSLLEQLPAAKEMTIEVQYSVPNKLRIKDYAGCVLYSAVPTNRVLHALVSVYMHSTHEFPRPHQVLYCTRACPWAELQAFLYRCFTSPDGQIFALVGGERLPIELQTAFRNLFAKLVGSAIGKGRFSLAVITSEENSLLAEYFQLLEDPRCIRVRDLNDEQALGHVIRQIDSRTCGGTTSSTLVVRSDAAGLGKSTLVRQQAQALGKRLIKFPISGSLDLEEITQKLLASDLSDSVLHLSLSHVDSPDILNDLVTHICLLRTARAGGLVAVFPPSCRIFIEVQNLQPSLPLPFLLYLTQEIVTFDISRIELTEDIRFVCSYLHLLDTNGLSRGNPNSVQVTSEMATQLISKFFLVPQEKRCQPLSYIAVHTFIGVMSVLLRNLEISPFVPALIDCMISDAAAAGISVLKQEYESLRGHIVNSFLQTCEEVLTRCVTQVKSSQGQAVASKQAAQTLECKLKWDDTNHFSMIFLRDGSHVAIYRKQQHVPLSLQKLIYIQSHCQTEDGPTLASRISSARLAIPDYSQLTHLQALRSLQTYAKCGASLDAKYKDSDYVLTPDNFLKMNLIYLRAIAKLPIVIMGETGCGKTSLIRFFVESVQLEPLLVINVHAGVTSQVLAEKVRAIFQKAAVSERIWVFFDEFNTSDCVGQICEMLCERTFFGAPLPENVVLLAACNPYRLRPEQLAEDSAGIKKSARYRSRLAQNLMHVVKPLPESVIEFIWDFGALTDSDSRKYIETMLRQMACPQYESLFAHLVWVSQKRFQELEDLSSVSLRDVARFTFLFRWFVESLRERKQLRSEPRFAENCRKYRLDCNWTVLNDEFCCAGVLALCNCYYYRLSKQSARLAYLSAICEQSKGALSLRGIEAVLRQNEHDWIARMELPSATALNQAFRENISCLIHCIFCKIALFICGKPGCSKSLAIQLVFSNLRGGKSMDAYFRLLPELVMVPFQGSESCTSEGIVRVFDRAKRFLSSGSLLPVVVFDEIGLAEISTHNPLKVLHSLLELEHRDVGFVGVSNWRLDASKMNRAMYLARPDPDQQELVFTARSIYKACTQETSSSAHLELVEVLALAYCAYKEEVRGTKDADFFGLRDFYSLIKQTSARLIEGSVTDTETMFRIVKKAVERNFGGKAGAAARMEKLVIGRRPEFEQFAHVPATLTIDLINENLGDPRARFLMLICQGDVATYALDKSIHLPQHRTLVGSHMAEDESGEEYGFRSLSDMILYMEKGISVILKDMDHIYTSLYDLFNQNFAVSGDRRYCRVALGAQFNPRCFVHSDFHVVVFMPDDDERLEQTDAPFLNRFEKHRFDVEQLLSPLHLQAYKGVTQWLQTLATLSCEHPSLISLSHAFPLYSPEYLKLLVLLIGDQSDCEDSLVSKCKMELLRMATQEVLLLAHTSMLDQHEKAFIFETWNSLHSQSFFEFLSESYRHSLVFTYDNEMLQSEQLNRMPVHYQHFSSFRKERDLVEDLVHFFRGQDQLYLLDLNLSKDGAHLAMIKFSIEKVASEFRKASQRVCLLVRLLRNSPVKVEVCWFDGWDLRTFSLTHKLRLTEELLDLAVPAVIQQGTFYSFEENIDRLMLEAYQTIAFRVGDMVTSEEEINNHIFSITEKVGSHPGLVEALRGKMLSLVTKRGWVEEVLCNPDCVRRAVNLQAALRTVVEVELAAVCSRVLFSLEKLAAFHSFFAESPEQPFLQQLWLCVFAELNCNLLPQNLRQSNRLNFQLSLDFPFVKRDHDMLKNISEESGERFLSKFAEGSVLKTRLEEVSGSRALQAMYFRDLIRIDLTTQKSISHYEDTLALLHDCWSAHKAAIAEKALVYSQQRAFGLALCELMSVLRELNIDVVPAVTAQLSALLDAPEEDSAPKVRQTLLAVFDEAMSSLCTFTSWLGDSGRVQQPALVFGRLNDWLGCLSAVHGFSVRNFDELDILSLLFQLLSQSPTGSVGLLQIQEAAATVTECSFLYSEPFSQRLLEVLQEHCSQEESLRFFSAYLLKLFSCDEVAYLPLIEGLVDEPDSGFWKHSACLIAEIALRSGLTRASDPIPAWQQTPFLDCLEVTLETSAKFQVLLCDAICHCWPPHCSKSTAPEFLARHCESFPSLLQAIADPHTQYPHTSKTFVSAFLRCYLEAYCWTVHFQTESVDERVLQRISQDLAEEVFPTARAYALKYWKHSQHLSVSELREALRSRPSLVWSSMFLFPEQHSEAIPFQSKTYSRTVGVLEAVLSGDGSLGKVVDSLASAEDRVAFATAFLMSAFLRLGRGETNERLAKVFAAERERIEQKVGPALCELMNCFVSNFPPGCLRLATNAREGELRRVLPLCFYLIILCAHSGLLSPLTSYVLDEGGRVRADAVAKTNSSFLCGVGVNPLYGWLQYLKDNFSTQKSTTSSQSFSKGSANKCSCDYVYIINKCGGPTEKRSCPFCDQPIGGTNHTWVSRPGHENLTDAQAIEFMESRIAHYKLNQEPGYWTFNDWNSSLPALRGISQTAHSILHLASVLLLYFLSATGLISADKLAEIVKSKQPVPDKPQHLDEAIRMDFAEVQRVLNTDDSHLWWYAVLKKLPAFAQEFQDSPLTLESRSLFEGRFDEFLRSFCESPVSIVRQEREQSAATSAGVVTMLDEANQGDYPHMHLFRLVSDPSVVSLGAQFELQQLSEKFPLIALYLRTQEVFERCRLLPPLLAFTNRLREQFDHRIRREQARAQSLAEVFRDDPKASDLFEQCAEVWEWLAAQELAYECHLLPPKRFSASDELIYFLVDKQESGGGLYMTAALMHLAEAQNTVMSGFLAAMEKKLRMEPSQILDMRKVPAQELKAENAVEFSLDSQSAFQSYFLNNPAFGEGKEVIYDYQRLEEQLQSSLEKGRLLSVELDFVSYQFEMLSASSKHSDLISSLRASVAQRPLDDRHTAAVEQFVARQEDDIDATHQQKLLSYYDSLGSLMCFLRNSKAAPALTIFAFAQGISRFHLCEVFTRPTVLSQVPLENVVALYELLECRLFPYSRDYVKSEFRARSEATQDLLEDADFEAAGPLGELQQAVMRLALRLLVADLNATQRLALYVTRLDLWPENCPEARIEAFAEKLQELPLAHSMQVYEFLEARTRRSRQSDQH